MFVCGGEYFEQIIVGMWYGLASQKRRLSTRDKSKTYDHITLWYSYRYMRYYIDGR